MQFAAADQNHDGVGERGPSQLICRQILDEFANGHRSLVENVDHGFVDVGAQRQRPQRSLECQLEVVGRDGERQSRLQPALARLQRRQRREALDENVAPKLPADNHVPRHLGELRIEDLSKKALLGFGEIDAIDMVGAGGLWPVEVDPAQLEIGAG